MSENKKVDKIEWLGIDGLLVASFFVICIIIFTSLVYRLDFIIGYLIPIVLLVTVTLVFINYCFTVVKFMKMKNEEIKK